MTINTAGYTLGSNRPLTNARILWNMMQGTATGDGTNPDRAANDYTAQRWTLGAGANDWVLTGPVAGYEANGVEPEFVGDFTGGVYRVDSTASTFADAFTFARTGTATFVDANGILQTAADGVARTGHHIWNGSEWAGPFLQLESEARTNLLLRSEEFDNAAWAKNLLTVTANFSTAPDGTTTADRIVSSGGAFPQIVQSATLTAGQSYTFSVWVKSDGTTQIAQALLIEGSVVSFTPTDTWVRVSVSVASSAGGSIASIIATNSATAPASSFLVWGAQLEAGSTPSSYIPTTGTTATRNAETLTIAAADAPWSGTAVSIQMEGTMTYADEDIAGNVVFFAQRADNDNLIDLKIDTNAALTGRYTIVQREGAVSDFVVSGDDTYSPGINVPFNIASRHGSTFVNGAIDGTALTANLTPTALPDLSATDVQIGPDFMGSIGRIVIWADDIGNAGIAAASNPQAAAVDVDTAFIAAHNLSGRTVTISTSPDLFTAYTTRATVTPTDNTTIAALFNDGSGDPIPTRRLKVSIDEGTGNAVGIIRAGEALQMERPFYAGHTPATKARVTEGQQSFSETGQWQGRTVKRVALTPEYNWQHLGKPWYDANFEPFAQTIPAKPFGIAGNPSAMPDDVAWAWTDQDARPSTMGLVDLMQVSLSVTGLR